MESFQINPCRQNIFEVFRLDKVETDPGAILAAINKAKTQLSNGIMVARDGTEFSLSEAQLNNLEKILLDPLERLKAEQLVHQAHFFSHDEEFAGAAHALRQEDDSMQMLLVDMKSALVVVLGQFLPSFTPPHLEDDQPWPDPPAPLELVREAWTAAILRDQ